MRKMTVISKLMFLVVIASSRMAPPVAAQGAGAPANTALTNAWTTYKGNPQRTGSSGVRIALPLSLTWRHSTDAAPGVNSSTPLVVGPTGSRRVYFAVGNFVFAVDAQTGEQIWRTDTHNFVRAPLTLLSGGESGDAILVLTARGLLLALRTSDGGQLWATNLKASTASTAPTLINTPRGERIVVGTTTGILVAVTRSGEVDPDWSVDLGRGVTPSSSPVLSSRGDQLLVTAQDGNLYGVDVSGTGTPFSSPLGATTYAAPALLGETLVVGAGERILGLREKDGSPLWQVDAGARILGGPAGRATAGGGATAYIGTNKGNFLAIDVSNGRTLWNVDLQDPVTGTPLVLPTVVLIGTRNGMLIGLKPQDGAVLWRYRLHSEREVPVRAPAPTDPAAAAPDAVDAAPTMRTRIFGVSSQPVAVEGQVFLLADNAALYTFEPKPFDAEPPRAVLPSLAVANDQGKIMPLLMGPDNPLGVPGRAPVYFATELNDTGSGVDPNSIKVTFTGPEGTPELAADRVLFDAGSGNLTVTLAGETAGAVTTLKDGNYTVGVLARDYLGNALTYTGTFTVDNTLPPPAAPAPPTAAPETPPATEPGAGGAV
jgi:outer membrane protein assembly factor BamB